MNIEHKQNPPVNINIIFAILLIMIILGLINS